MIIKTALAATLILGSASMALAAHYTTHGGLQTRNVSYSYASGREAWMDRASRNWSGGGY